MSARGNASVEERAGDRSRLTFVQRVAVTLGPTLIRLLASTWRVREVNAIAWRARLSRGETHLYALWHGEMLPLVAQHRKQGIAVVISEHRDGELITQIVERFGFTTIRGSTSQGGTRALLGIVKTLGEGVRVAITPDGPRGPLHSFASGGIVAAQRANAPIIGVSVYASRAWRLRSWDAFMIPKPFARVVFAYSDPTFVDAPDARGAALEVDRFQSLMADIEVRARNAAHHRISDRP